MNIQLKTYIGTPVFTQNGQAVGKLADLEIDSDTGRIANIFVKTKGLLTGLLEDQMIVPWSAIIELGKDRVVIIDGLLPESSRLAQVAKAAVAPSLMKEG